MQIILDLDEYDREYDTDEVSVTSTTVPDAEDEYDAECIISEAHSEGEGPKYLIKWVGYPLHECTWEPPENFVKGKKMLRHWEARKLEMSEEAFYKMNVDHYDMFEESKEKAAEAKARRQAKRMKKRRKLEQAQKPQSDDDDDVPVLPHRRKSMSSKGEGSNAKQKQTQRLPLNRKDPFKDSPSSSEAPSDADSAATEDSLLEELSSRQKRKKKRIDGPASASEKGKQNIPTASSARERQETEKLSKALSNATSPINTKHKPDTARKVWSSDPSNSEPIAKIIRSNNVNAAKVPRPIKMVNQPKPKPREWKSDKLYSTLQSQNKGRKHFQAEGTPDPSSLEFVNGTPTGRLPPRGPSAITLASADNPFGRRESGLRRAVNDLSPPSSPKQPLRPFEIGKIPMVCFDYRTGNNCRYSAQDCKFMHRNTSPSGRLYKISDWNGRVPGKYAVPPLTCYFWMRGKHGCSSSAEDCDFAHENTGMLANAGNGRPEPIDKNEVPLTERSNASAGVFTDPAAIHTKNSLTCWYWIRGSHGCIKPVDECKFAHWNTGTLLDKDGSSKPISPEEKPSFSKFSEQTCFFWNHRVCAFEPGRCRSRHEYTGQVVRPPHAWKPPPGFIHRKLRYKDQNADEFTCFLWTKGKCPKTEEKCHFSHSRLAQVADPPPGFVEPPAVKEHNTQPQLSHPSPQHMKESAVRQESNQASPVTTDDDVIMENTDPPERVSPPPAPPVLSLQTNLEQFPDYISTMKLKEWIEDVCKLDFKDMFVYNGENDRDATLDKRAFLIFHPKEHTEELEILTRWLLIHHVEVYNFWSDGSWTAFAKEIVRGGSGIVVAHPEFDAFAEIPKFSQILAAKVRIWSVGHQAGFEFDTSVPAVFPPHSIKYRYDRIEIFPHGGIIYVTDYIFLQKPQQALTIIKYFLGKIEACRAVDGPSDPWRLPTDGFLPWRLGVRPEFMQFLYDMVITHEKGIQAGDPIQMARLELYNLLSASPYVQQDTGHTNTLDNGPADYFPIISTRRDITIEPFFSAVKASSAVATGMLVEHFSRMVVEQRQLYRKFFVVHGIAESNMVNNWKKKYGVLVDVLTAEKCIEEFEKDPKASRFDFFEWAFEKKKKGDGGQGVQEGGGGGGE